MDEENMDPASTSIRDKLMKNKIKEEKKQKIALEKHLIEMKKNRELLPKPVIDRKIRLN
jgi:hypothetical protein